MPHRKSHVNPSLITAANIRNVTRLVPRLRNIRAAQGFNKYKKVGNTITIPAEIHKPIVTKLMRVLADNNFVQPFDWVSWEHEAVRFFRSTSKLENANLETCVELLILYVQRTGSVKGRIQRILKRIGRISNAHIGERL
jgi:hypothetical protein